MNNICPVCQNSVEKGATECGNCGFTDKLGINREWPIIEDAQNWLETVVKPYRIQWEARKWETDSKNIYCTNCGKELQEEWLRCPYCSTPVEKKSQVTSSAISSGSGIWGYGIGQIKPAMPVFSDDTVSQAQLPVQNTVDVTDECNECPYKEIKETIKCDYYSCDISEAREYDCGMKTSNSNYQVLRKKARDKILVWGLSCVVMLIGLIGGFILMFLDKLPGAISLIGISGLVIFINNSIKEKRRQNAKRLSR
jgi:hypothetical protein